VGLRARIHNTKDVAAGALFAAIGLATIVGASDYPLGTIRNIGPGYFPIVLGIALALLGAAVAAQGMSFSAASDATADQGQQIEDEDDGIAIRPLVVIPLAVIAFALLVRPFGLAIATIALVGLSSLAGREFKWRTVVLLSAGLIALSWTTFIYLLGLPMTIWPR
jgi:putative tricarboxylic transport membrane protein